MGVQNVNVDVHDVTRTDAHTMAVHAHAETFDPKVESLFRYLQVSCTCLDRCVQPACRCGTLTGSVTGLPSPDDEALPPRCDHPGLLAARCSLLP
jgi:hypothetical protein